jgi:hypothetical protein
VLVEVLMAGVERVDGVIGVCWLDGRPAVAGEHRPVDATRSGCFAEAAMNRPSAKTTGASRNPVSANPLAGVETSGLQGLRLVRPTPRAISRSD